MLILTRRIGESIRIGDDVTVIVLGVQGNAVRVGVDAPKAVPVHRQEVYEAIHTGSTEQAQPGELPPRQAANA